METDHFPLDDGLGGGHYRPQENNSGQLTDYIGTIRYPPLRAMMENACILKITLNAHEPPTWTQTIGKLTLFQQSQQRAKRTHSGTRNLRRFRS
jgi:hypothetical protein